MPGVTGQTAGDAPPAATRAAKSASIRDLVTAGFYYQRLVLAVLVAAMLIGVAGWFLSPIRFTAEVQLLLLPGSDSIKSATDLANPFGGSIARDVSSEVEFLRNRALFAKVAERIGPAKVDPHIGDRRWFGLLPPIPEQQQINAAVNIIERHLKVTTPNDSNLMVVNFTHEDRESAIAILDTLIDVYLQRRSEVNRSLKSPFLKEKADFYAKQLKDLEDDIRDLKAKDNILDLTQEILLALNQVDTGEQRHRSESQRRAGLLAERESTRKTITLFQPRQFEFEEHADHATNDDTDNVLAKLYVERDRLKQLYQDDDPAVADIERQIETLEKLKKKGDRTFTVTREGRNPAIEFLNNHLAQVEVESQSVDRMLEEIDKEIETSQKRVDQLRSAQTELTALERSHAIADQLYRDFSLRAEAAQVEEAAAALKTANIRIVANADAPTQGTSNGFNLFLASIAAGLLVGFSAAVAADWSRQVFLQPTEIEDWLHLPVIASFNDGQLPLGERTNGQIIYFAGQLGFSRNADSKLQTVQIVSQGRREYRDEVTLALATELASGQNMRTLMLDIAGDGCALWRTQKEPPAQREFAGFLTAPSQVPNLDVSIGATNSDINWMRANNEILDNLFARLSEHYDMIVINSPPFRDGTEAIRLANLVDGSLLVVRAEHTRSPVVEVLVTQLLGAGGDLFGAVMTGRKLYIPRAIYRWL
jgi:polysaccharide biosynthesis transport protein